MPTISTRSAEGLHRRNGSQSDTLYARTRAIIDGIRTEVETALTRAQSARIDAERARIAAAATAAEERLEGVMALCTDVESLLQEARERRLSNEKERLQAAMDELSNLHTTVSEFLRAAENNRLDNEKNRLETADADLAQRLDAVQGIRDSTKALIDSIGWNAA